MYKKYNYVVKMTVNAVCKTPLRVGNHENNTETVLKYADGTPFIPATAITGVFKDYMEQIGCKKESSVLFGDRRIESKVIISDGVFSQSNEVLRPRVRIDDETGATVLGGKFDVAHIETGAVFSFALTWLGEGEEAKEEVQMLYEILLALNDGDIALGGQKTNGFGRVKIDEVLEQKLDLKVENDRNHWLNDTGKSQLLRLDKIEKLHRLDCTTFEVVGKAENILVKSSQNEIVKESKDGKETKVTYEVNMKENKKDIIPGSSIKGAVRSRALAIAEAMAGDIVAAETIIDELFGNQEFGNQDARGSIFFEDIILANPKTVKVTRIRINKFTGGVIDSALLSEKPICADFTFTIRVPKRSNMKNHEMACKIITFVLRDLSAGLFVIGSGKGIGRGELDVEKINIISKNEEVIETATIAVKHTENKEKQIVLDDKDGLISKWLR